MGEITQGVCQIFLIKRRYKRAILGLNRGLSMPVGPPWLFGRLHNIDTTEDGLVVYDSRIELELDLQRLLSSPDHDSTINSTR